MLPEKRNIKLINLDLIVNNPSNPKRRMDKQYAKALELSLKTFGVRGILLVYPVEKIPNYVKIKNEQYIFVDGNSRYEIFKKLNYKEVMCEILDCFSWVEIQKLILTWDRIKKNYDKKKEFEYINDIIQVQPETKFEDLSELLVFNKDIYDFSFLDSEKTSPVSDISETNYTTGNGKKEIFFYVATDVYERFQNIKQQNQKNKESLFVYMLELAEKATE